MMPNTFQNPIILLVRFELFLREIYRVVAFNLHKVIPACFMIVEALVLLVVVNIEILGESLKILSGHE